MDYYNRSHQLNTGTSTLCTSFPCIQIYYYTTHSAGRASRSQSFENSSEQLAYGLRDDIDDTHSYWIQRRF